MNEMERLTKVSNANRPAGYDIPAKTKTANSVYDRLRKAETSPAWDRAGAYAIMKGSDYVGKILCKYPVDGMGPLEVFLWDWTPNAEGKSSREIQWGRASGCGYDKLAAAMEGLKFGAIVFSDHPTDWKTQLHEAGYQLLNVL